MKLELKHLAPYLPYGLKCLNQNLPDIEYVSEELKGISNHIGWACRFDAVYGSNHIPICAIKPILRPLEDLKVEIEYKNNLGLIGNVSMKDLNFISKGDMCFVSFRGVEELFKQHFDVFGLIPKGLAIDINTLK